MSSFTDEIAQYNPYIQQLPVDDYINAGMQLQARYNEGVQKTQSYIDNVSGIQVAGEANRQYLEGKVSQLESKVSQVASSDFAKNSLSSQVGSLAGMIEKDPVIQAGMSSAVRLQQYQKNWDDLEKNHPDQYSAKNKEYYDQFVGDYLKQSKDKAGLVYNGPTEATPYVDYYGKLDKELKGLDPSIQTRISPNGEFSYFVDKESSISKEKIDGVVNSVLLSDPRISNQMQIDAWHAYRSFDAPQMFDHINQSFGSMIEDYRAHAKYYQDVIKANPNDYAKINDAQKRMLDYNTEINNLNHNRENYLSALNSGSLDQVKQSVFNDSIRQGLVLKYAKSDIQTDIKNNENAIQNLKKYEVDKKFYLDYIKEGLDPNTGQGITPDNPLYTAYLNVLNTAKNKLKTPENGGPDQSVAVAGVVPDKYTEDAHNAAIVSLQSQVGETLTKLRSFHSNLDDKSWGAYLDQQEGKYQAGDPSIDPKYAQYKSIIQPQEALLNTYTTISSKIHTDAANKFKINDALPKTATFTGLGATYIADDNTVKSRDLVADKGVLEQAIEISQAAGRGLKSFYTNSANPGMQANTPSQSAIDNTYLQAAAKYKSDKNYEAILRLSKSPQLLKYSDAANAVMANREGEVAKEFSDYGQTTSYQAQPIIGKKEEIDQLKRLTATAAAQQGVQEDADKINPVNYYNNDAGKVVIQYQRDKDGKMYQVEVPAARNILGNPDPYQQIARVIDLSPTKSTPLDPHQALSSVNGKVKYVIQKDPLGGDYEMRIWSRGALYTVPAFSLDGNSFAKPNIGSYVERAEKLSQLAPAQLEALMKTSFTGQ